MKLCFEEVQSDPWHYVSSPWQLASGITRAIHPLYRSGGKRCSLFGKRTQAMMRVLLPVIVTDLPSQGHQECQGSLGCPPQLDSLLSQRHWECQGSMCFPPQLGTLPSQGHGECGGSMCCPPQFTVTRVLGMSGKHGLSSTVVQLCELVWPTSWPPHSVLAFIYLEF